ncbi:MAG: outer membrane lipoprotein-sorting protein [Cyclobacteriaceae bacterium]|nr:outer membrane lipoprotein-sorting protein [Cyclobacteriaceae bacterium]
MRKFILLLFLIPFQFFLQAQTAGEIIKKADERMQGKSSQGTMTMKIIRPKWTREITMKSWSKGTDYSMVLITAPARDQGSGFLKRDKELWSWQPSIDRVIKMPPSMMMQSWMGSDFTNDDLVKQSSIVNDFDHFLEKDTVIQGYEAWKIVLKPKEEAAVVWGKIEAYISKKDFYELLFNYYDEDEYLINTMILSEIKLLGDRMVPTKMEMIPAENPEQKTIILYQDFAYNVELDESFFSIQNLKQIR